MIEAAEITNFECHKYTLLEFSPGLNAIVGMTDKGKSSVKRAIEWCARNEPSGLDFRPWTVDKKELTSVTISKTDGKWVTRERNENINRYLSCDKKDPLEAFGQGPVKEILETLNLSDFAIQGQFEQYFLLQSSPTEVSRFLNETIGLDVADELIKTINSIIYKTRDGADNAQEQIERLTEEIKEYDYLNQLEVEIGVLEKALLEREQGREERRLLLALIHQLEQANEQIQELTEWLEVEKEAQGIINEVQDLNVIAKEKEQLEKIIVKLESLNNDIVGFNEEVEDHQRATQLYQEMKEFHRELENYRVIRECVERLDVLESGIMNIDLQLKGLKEEKNKYGIICQKCGTRIEI
jgi:hypothetical protein